jgi:ketosteroid isomerase-like protein
MTSMEREVLEANSAFYAAFAQRDAEAMDSLWAREAPVACLHPGWEPLSGREAVVSSWRRILLGGGAPPDIRCEGASANVAGEAAWVVCTEIVPGGSLGATNVFVRERGAWRLVHHHASPLPRPAPRRAGFRN